jgi:hypothetical protein
MSSANVPQSSDDIKVTFGLKSTIVSNHLGTIAIERHFYKYI